jgi:hypothetical protein
MKLTLIMAALLILAGCCLDDGSGCEVGPQPCVTTACPSASPRQVIVRYKCGGEAGYSPLCRAWVATPSPAPTLTPSPDRENGPG